MLAAVSAADAARLTSTSFFPSLIATPFHEGVVLVSIFSIVAFLVAAIASWMRGGRYVHDELEAEHMEADLIAAGEQEAQRRYPAGAVGSRVALETERVALETEVVPEQEG